MYRLVKVKAGEREILHPAFTAIEPDLAAAFWMRG